MKLAKNQYNDILKAIQEHGIDEKNFLLSKKKGRIRIQISDTSSFFEFFKRKSVELKADRQRQPIEHYEIFIAEQAFMVSTWGEVIQRLRSWLRKNS